METESSSITDNHTISTTTSQFNSNHTNTTPYQVQKPKPWHPSQVLTVSQNTNAGDARIAGSPTQWNKWIAHSHAAVCVVTRALMRWLATTSELENLWTSLLMVVNTGFMTRTHWRPSECLQLRAKEPEVRLGVDYSRSAGDKAHSTDSFDQVSIDTLC